jgi:hypothetical protein
LLSHKIKVSISVLNGFPIEYLRTDRLLAYNARTPNACYCTYSVSYLENPTLSDKFYYLLLTDNLI